ncbi:hypothetical protein [Cyclobacterium marinum]|uniref:Uncharacterized protein n=1 Tax=Cyclobacterium marinum (strain ATCC 25205 / DSM 745 / LMG 13164 / NCIMB 1802) TaxID=880070 RepID=G0IY29_CYCMS|nr:hypothetical protein [Cyclobacterium marinum]AEL24362.1 hypothetical protein Cycma_0587 [Cyclobacterium marinum DSM 745]
MIRTVNQFFGSINSGDNLLFENASIIMSPYLINDAYTGYCWKVRRESDSALLEVGFDLSGKVNESILTSFLGSGIGRLNTYYNQAGNNNAVAPALFREPLIWDNGFIPGLEGHPSIDFEGGAQKRLMFDSMIETITANGSLFMAVIDRIDESIIQQVLSNQSINHQFRLTTENQMDLGGTEAPFNVFNTPSPKKIIGFDINTITEESFIFDEYVNSSPTSFSVSTLPSWKLNQLGARANTGELYRGRMHEVFFFPDRKLTNKRNIVRNRKAIYNP